MDHGVTLGVPEGMTDVPCTVEKVIAGYRRGNNGPSTQMAHSKR